MLTHGCIMAAMSQGQAWTTPYTTPGTEKIVCVLPLFHIYALSGITLGAVRNGNQLDPLSEARHRHDRQRPRQEETDLPARRADALHRDQQASQGQGARPLLAEDLHVRRRAAAGGSAAELREAHRRHLDRGLRPDRDLAHRRDLPGRQERAPRRLVRPADARHDHRDPLARGSATRCWAPARRMSARSASSARR